MKHGEGDGLGQTGGKTPAVHDNALRICRIGLSRVAPAQAGLHVLATPTRIAA